MQPVDKLLELHCYKSAAGLLQLVSTNLQQTCSKAVATTCQHCLFALLTPSLLTTWYKVVEPDILVTSCSSNLLSSCNSTSCEGQVCSNLIKYIITLLQLVDTGLLQACCKHILLTSCKIFTCVKEKQYPGARAKALYTRKILTSCTHANILHLVTSLSTSRQQVVFALLVASC